MARRRARFGPFDRRAVFAAVVATVLAVAGMAVATSAARASAGCEVDYTVTSQWQGGFGANITVSDQGDPVTAASASGSTGPGPAAIRSPRTSL